MIEWLALGPDRLAPIVLGVLWIHVLLGVAACLKEAVRVRRRLLAFATIRCPEGPGALRVQVPDGGPVARGVREQVGRALDGPGRVIAFHDRATVHELVGARVIHEGTPIAVEAEPDRLEVWVIRGALEEPAIDDEERTWARARSVGGCRRQLSWAVGPGEAWLAGVFGRRDGGLVARPHPVHGMVVADVEPAPLLFRQLALALAMALALLVGAAVCTALVFIPPPFGVMSTIGAFAWLGFFLLAVIPGAHLVRVRVTPPCFRPMGGTRTLGAPRSEDRNRASAR